ncbi:DUF1206 domain-containing protein [Sphingomonas sp.]
MDAGERIGMLARAGYAARAIVYFALGYLTLATGRAEGTSSVLDPLADVPGGQALMVLLGLGLAAYGLFRLYGAWVDLEDDGRDAKGLGKRAGHVASGLAHLGIAWGAFALAAGGDGPDDGGAGREAASMALDLPGGWLIVMLAAAAFAVAAIAQAKKAWTADFMRLLTRDTPHWACTVGRIGHAARSAVFAAIAWTVFDIALSGQPGSVGFQDALAAYRGRDWLYPAIAFGLLLFGVFSLVMARYRNVCDTPFVRRLLAG